VITSHMSRSFQQYVSQMYVFSFGLSTLFVSTASFPSRYTGLVVRLMRAPPGCRGHCMRGWLPSPYVSTCDLQLAPPPRIFRCPGAAEAVSPAESRIHHRIGPGGKLGAWRACHSSKKRRLKYSEVVACSCLRPLSPHTSPTQLACCFIFEFVCACVCACVYMCACSFSCVHVCMRVHMCA
jgi:hypothetical protein